MHYSDAIEGLHNVGEAIRRQHSKKSVYPRHRSPVLPLAEPLILASALSRADKGRWFNSVGNFRNIKGGG